MLNYKKLSKRYNSYIKYNNYIKYKIIFIYI